MYGEILQKIHQQEHFLKPPIIAYRSYNFHLVFYAYVNPLNSSTLCICIYIIDRLPLRKTTGVVGNFGFRFNFSSTLD